MADRHRVLQSRGRYEVLGKPFCSPQRAEPTAATFPRDGPAQPTAPYVLRVALRFLDEESGFLPEADDAEAGFDEGARPALADPVPPAQATAALCEGTVTMLFNCSPCGDGPCRPFGGDAAAGGAVWRIAAEHGEDVGTSDAVRWQWRGVLVYTNVPVWLVPGDGAGRVHAQYRMGLASRVQQRVGRVQGRRSRRRGVLPVTDVCGGAAPSEAAVPVPRDSDSRAGTSCHSSRHIRRSGSGRTHPEVRAPRARPQPSAVHCV